MLIIRPYQEDDKQLVMKLHRDVLSDLGIFIDDPILDADLENIHQVYGKEHRGAFMVAMNEESLVAMGGLKSVSSTIAEIKRMRVAVQYQRRGVGQQILNELIAQARSFGYSHLRFAAAEVQHQAQRMCTRNGFIPVGGGEVCGLETIFYEKSLTLTEVSTSNT